MSILTLDYGVTNLTVACQKGGHAVSRQVGGKTVAFAGAETTNVRGEFMVVPVILEPLPFATVATIRALFALGAQVPCRGDVFNRGSVTITCSGSITDEIRETADGFVVNLTLYEIGTAAYTPAVTLVYLSNQASPADGTKNMASTDPADDPFSAGTGNVTLLTGAGTIPTCGSPLFPDPTASCASVTSGASEKTWRSKPSPNGGYITGAPLATLTSIGGVGDAWAIQDCMLKVFVVRSGADVAEWDTAFSAGNGGFAGGTITAAAPAIIFLAQIGDYLRCQLYGRAAVHSGYAVGTLQQITFGNGGGGFHNATLTLGGSVLFQ